MLLVFDYGTLQSVFRAFHYVSPSIHDPPMTYWCGYWVVWKLSFLILRTSDCSKPFGLNKVSVFWVLLASAFANSVSQSLRFTNSVSQSLRFTKSPFFEFYLRWKLQLSQTQLSQSLRRPFVLICFDCRSRSFPGVCFFFCVSWLWFFVRCENRMQVNDPQWIQIGIFWVFLSLKYYEFFWAWNIMSFFCYVSGFCVLRVARFYGFPYHPFGWGVWLFFARDMMGVFWWCFLLRFIFVFLLGNICDVFFGICCSVFFRLFYFIFIIYEKKVISTY